MRVLYIWLWNRSEASTTPSRPTLGRPVEPGSHLARQMADQDPAKRESRADTAIHVQAAGA